MDRGANSISIRWNNNQMSDYATTSSASRNTYVVNANGSFTFGVTGGRTLVGCYTLSGRTLTLASSDGTTERRTVFGASSSTPISLASIEGDTYRCRQ